MLVESNLWSTQQVFKQAEAYQGKAEEYDEEDHLALFYDSAAVFFDQADEPVCDQINDNGVEGKEEKICHNFNLASGQSDACLLPLMDL